METFYLYYIGLFLLLAGLCMYWSVACGPGSEEPVGVWLPALLLSLPGMGLILGAMWLLLGSVRFHALLSLLSVRWYRGLTPVDYRYDFACVFIGGTLLLFLALKRVLGQAARRRSDDAIARAILEAQQESRVAPRKDYR